MEDQTVKNPDKGGVQSVARIFELIEVLAAHPAGASLQRLAEDAHLAKSTTHRLLGSLVSLGYAAQDGETGKYRLTLKMFEISSGIVNSMDVMSVAKVHLERLAQRTGEETTVKVYSNLPKVALYVDGRLFAEQEGSKVFVFEHVPMSDGFTQISARAGACADAMSIEKVAEPNQAYIYVDPDDTGDDAGAANWFNVDDYKDVDTIVVREGYFSVKDKIGDIMKNEEAGNVLMQFMQENQDAAVMNRLIVDICKNGITAFFIIFSLVIGVAIPMLIFKRLSYTRHLVKEP